MNTTSRTITGIIMVLAGVGLIAFSLRGTKWLLLYGIPMLFIGIFIFFNKKEDEIEKIKK